MWRSNFIIMIVPRSQGVLNVKYIFRKKCVFGEGKKKMSYNNSSNLTGDIHWTSPKEDAPLRTSPDSLFIWHINMKDGSLPSGAWPLHYRILLLRLLQLLFQTIVQQDLLHFNHGSWKIHITLSILVDVSSQIMNLALGTNIYIIIENRHMYSQLLVSSGNGMQKSM